MFICVLHFDMATQFYLTHPSNSSLEYFPNNTVANFKVRLAESIGLTGEWEEPHDNDVNESDSGEKDQDEDENEDHDITRVP